MINYIAKKLYEIFKKPEILEKEPVIKPEKDWNLIFYSGTTKTQSNTGWKTLSSRTTSAFDEAFSKGKTITNVPGISGASGHSGLAGTSGIPRKAGEVPGTAGSSGFQGTSGMPGFAGTSGMPGFAEYISENLDRSIRYSEYVAENVDRNIRYAEYIAEKINEVSFHDWSNTQEMPHYRKSMTPKPKKEINRVYSAEDPYGEEDWGE